MDESVDDVFCTGFWLISVCQNKLIFLTSPPSGNSNLKVDFAFGYFPHLESWGKHVNTWNAAIGSSNSLNWLVSCCLFFIESLKSGRRWGDGNVTWRSVAVVGVFGCYQPTSQEFKITVHAFKISNGWNKQSADRF
jgi:hypothetical protein